MGKSGKKKGDLTYTMRSNVHKRSQVRKNKSKIKQLTILGVNAAGIKCKMQSLSNTLKELKPHIWILQETKLRKQVSLNGKSQICIIYII